MTAIFDVDPTAVVRVRGIRARRARRTRRLLLVLACALVAVVACRVLLGDFTVSLVDFVRIVAGADIPGATYIVMGSKLPRAVLGVLVGIGFGLAGAIFQTTLRNPLASPDILGVSFGASASAVFAIVSLGATGWTVSAFAMAGAVSVAVMVRLVVGSNAAQRIVLVGIGLSASLFAVVQYLFTRADEWDAQLVLRWLTGSLNQADWPTIWILSAALLLILPSVALLSGSARIHELGDDLAAGLGVSARRSDLLLLLAVLLCAVATAAAGPLAFVAFLSGPVARALNGGRTTLTGSALVGAILVVAADYVAAYLVPDVNFPVGVVTGAVGAPFLMWLLATGRAVSSRRTS